jgi:hypothetical protein
MARPQNSTPYSRPVLNHKVTLGSNQMQHVFSRDGDQVQTPGEDEITADPDAASEEAAADADLSEGQPGEESRSDAEA